VGHRAATRAHAIPFGTSYTHCDHGPPSVALLLCQVGEQTLTPMAKQITLGWDYWNKKQHDLRRDMLQLHYYVLLEATISVRATVCSTHHTI
jgi:hypothetical protein